MNNKGQEGLGVIIIAAIAIIVGTIFLVVIAQEVGTSTSTITINDTINTVVNGTPQYLTSYRALSNVVVYNETAWAVISADNYTITNNVIDPTTGGLSVRILPDADDASKNAWYITATAQKTDYIANPAGRAIAGLIVVFFALAVLTTALAPTLGSKLLEAIGK